jgi:hypothetical protein
MILSGKYMPPSEELGDATKKQWMSLRIEKREFDAIKKVIVGNASPDDRALLESMVARTQAELCATVRTAQHPVAAALETMTLKQRWGALDKHYATRKASTWTQARSARPTPEEFRAWLDATFPDRREIGMVLSDLSHLDWPAYRKALAWSGAREKIPEAIFETFGLSSRYTPYDPERDADAPKSIAELYARAERGEDTTKNLYRAYHRAGLHRSRSNE